MPSICKVVLSKTGDALVEVLLSIVELPFWWGHTHNPPHTHTAHTFSLLFTHAQVTYIMHPHSRHTHSGRHSPRIKRLGV